MAEKDKDKQLEQNKNTGEPSHMSRVVTIGFFAGVFWSILGFLAYYFNFSKVGPALVLNPIAFGEWKNEVLGQVIGILVIGVLSIGVAVFYNAILQKTEKFWVGPIFGLVLWGIVFYLLNPIFPDLKPVTEIGKNTITTTVCLYLLYGLFIGYSISYDANEMRSGNREINYSK